MKLGTMYLKGNSMIPGFECRSSLQISFGDTVPGKALQWVQYGKLLVADRCACYMIAWEDLDRLGYIFGYPVRINGKSYLCRSLKVGAEKTRRNEWNSIIAKLGDSDDLWHWKGKFFWGQETPKISPTARVVRGYASARESNYANMNNRSATVGFRPVLEPLSPIPQSLNRWVGKRICVYGPEKTILEGRLEDADDYDLVLKMDEPLPNKCSWAVKKDGVIIINRENVAWIKKPQVF